MKGIQDIERLTSRIFLGHANARDLIGLKNSLQNLPILEENLQSFNTPILMKFTSEIENFDDLCQLLESSIVENPPLTIREGGIIKPNYDKELDGLREIGREGKGWILQLESGGEEEDWNFLFESSI